MIQAVHAARRHAGGEIGRSEQESHAGMFKSYTQRLIKNSCLYKKLTNNDHY